MFIIYSVIFPAMVSRVCACGQDAEVGLDGLEVDLLLAGGSHEHS